MKKTFCDICGIEVTENNNQNSLRCPIKLENTSACTESVVHLFVGLSRPKYHIDICKYCILEELNKQDDREELVSPAAPYRTGIMPCSDKKPALEFTQKEDFDAPPFEL